MPKHWCRLQQLAKKHRITRYKKWVTYFKINYRSQRYRTWLIWYKLLGLAMYNAKISQALHRRILFWCLYGFATGEMNVTSKSVILYQMVLFNYCKVTILPINYINKIMYSHCLSRFAYLLLDKPLIDVVRSIDLQTYRHKPQVCSWRLDGSHMSKSYQCQVECHMGILLGGYCCEKTETKKIMQLFMLEIWSILKGKMSYLFWPGLFWKYKERQK